MKNKEIKKKTFNEQIEENNKKWQSFSKKEKIIRSGIVIGAFSIMLISINSLMADDNKKEEVRAVQEVQMENLSPEDQIKAIFPNLETYSMGSIFYLKGPAEYNKLDLVKHKVKKYYKELAPFYNYLASQGIDTVCVWLNTGFVDKYGNTYEDTGYRINLALEDLQKLNWDNEHLIDIERLTDDIYVHPAYYKQK